jgi:hypothetical protein
MKYLSIDIETTGLEPERNQMIEFGCVIEDTLHPEIPVQNLPSFRALIPRKTYVISPFCLGMHTRLLDELRGQIPQDDGCYYIIDIIKDPSTTYVCAPDALESVFQAWLWKQLPDVKKYVVAGKNFWGFDNKFLNFKKIKFHHRTLDPVMLYIKPEDEVPPSLVTCCERAGIELKDYHTAVGDASTVIELIRCGLAA